MRSRITQKELIKAAARASAKAVSRTREAGGPITYQQGKKIIKEYPDGTKEVVQLLEKAFVRVKKKRLNLSAINKKIP